MSGNFSVIVEDFQADLSAISDLIRIVDRGGGTSKSRIASVNSATLLLAATFEEFVREIGRQYARELVNATQNVDELPRKLPATAWKRTIEDIARAKIDTGGTLRSLNQIAASARVQFESICKFIEGDIAQDIYKDLVHNPNNMRPNQLNEIFSIFGIENIYLKMSSNTELQDFFGESDANKCHGRSLVYLNDFMERRNEISHSINSRNSVTVDQLTTDIRFMECVAIALATTLVTYLQTLQPA